ncbi:MAG: hypothetical protein WCR52_03450 [Bacteroidota bacterium]
MKKTILALAGFLLLAGVGVAQEDGAKNAKSAGKALATYNMDRANNNAKLTEAKQKIDQALQTTEAQALPSAWLTKGDVYSTFIENDMARRLIDQKAPLTGDNDALIAYDAYKKAYDIAVKKYDKSDAVKGISAMQAHLINIGVDKYSAGAYDKSFASFRAALQAHDVLKENSQKSILDDAKQLDDITYFTGKSASLAKLNKEALVYYEKLYTKGTENTDVYQSIYDAKIAMGDEAGAAKILDEGRKKFPNDPSLLFTEINVYLKAGKLSELTDRLKQAIKQEPNNVGLYVTLGNVFDNLYQGALKDKNDKGAKEYFDEASSYYNQALAKDPKSVDAVYSLGALYYNKAALRTQEMNALPDDFSSAGLKKSEAFKNEIMGLFDQALPYFQKAESLNPNDTNTLIALTEIYARKEDDLSLTFKKRLEVVKAGGKNPDSHFKQ